MVALDVAEMPDPSLILVAVDVPETQRGKAKKGIKVDSCENKPTDHSLNHLAAPIQPPLMSTSRGLKPMPYYICK
jgi:hypothetical protein